MVILSIRLHRVLDAAVATVCTLLVMLRLKMLAEKINEITEKLRNTDIWIWILCHQLRLLHVWHDEFQYRTWVDKRFCSAKINKHLLNFGVRISGALIAPTYLCKQMMENELMNIKLFRWNRLFVLIHMGENDHIRKFNIYQFTDRCIKDQAMDIFFSKIANPALPSLTRSHTFHPIHLLRIWIWLIDYILFIQNYVWPFRSQ